MERKTNFVVWLKKLKTYHLQFHELEIEREMTLVVV
jgi:hypothetical protein